MEKKRVLINTKFWPQNAGVQPREVEQAIADLREIADIELYTPASEDETIKRIKNVDAAIPQLRTNWKEFLEAADRLKMIQVPAQGLVLLNISACTKRGIICCNVQNVGAESVAQHALALMFTLSKHVVQEDRALRSGAPHTNYGMELDGKTLGLIGLGSVGGRIALKGRLAFNMRVLAYDPYIPFGEDQLYGAKFTGLEMLLRESDVIVVCALLTPETRGMIGSKQLSLMKRSVLLVNMTGAVVDEKALVEALQEKKLSGAGIDVLEENPLKAASLPKPYVKALHAIDGVDVIVTPHSSRLTLEATTKARLAAINNIARYLKGQRPFWVINPSVLQPRK